jgi:hypothetical protein
MFNYLGWLLHASIKTIYHTNILFRFEAEIRITKCPENRDDWKQSFDIQVIGIEEKLTVELEFVCECGCEVPGSEVELEDTLVFEPSVRYIGLSQYYINIVLLPILRLGL